ncbi:hypothetical protein QCD60_14550 [Pokkaliibacter sp. MBI-7]|uniref:immunity protein Imm33 domain-containing protein n=1 Tax=Pokkaliibacter sp. MBI-7 TaxID=3040600 RepID=UPI002448B866|nr:hypothetical protein [Pokkaliibacter sp. MBI-7]MDH2433790.1 hypothetical protein [Pokkaliibacter sp. MBI-7]
MKIEREQTICEWAGVALDKPECGSKTGIVLGTIGKRPINGLRHKPEKGTCGWYIWCGEEIGKEDDFFSPLHVEHIVEYLSKVQAYLMLPPGDRFLIDVSEYKGVWYGEKLLNT